MTQIDLELGEPVKWVNPETGGWEVGRTVKSGDSTITKDNDQFILVAKTYGGLCFVRYAALERVAMRSEWEKSA